MLFFVFVECRPLVCLCNVCSYCPHAYHIAFNVCLVERKSAYVQVNFKCSVCSFLTFSCFENCSTFVAMVPQLWAGNIKVRNTLAAQRYHVCLCLSPFFFSSCCFGSVWSLFFVRLSRAVNQRQFYR